MSESGVKQDSAMGQHDAYVDTPCSRCESKGRYVDATCHCPTCDKQFCDACKDLHQEFTGSKTHELLDSSRKDQWGAQHPMVASGEEECTRHQGQFITIFCGQHDEICCTVCAALNHSTCENKAFIPEIAHGVSKSKDVKELIEGMNELKKELKSIKDMKYSARSSLNEFGTDYQTRMKSFRKRIDDALNTMEKRTNDTMSTLYQRCDEQIQSDMEKCDTFVKEMQDIEAQLDPTTGNKTEVQIYTAMKRGVQKVSEYQFEMRFLKHSTSSVLKFSPNESICENLETAETFGHFKQQPLCSQECQSIDNGKYVNIRAITDKCKCDIQGMCQLLDGSVVLADYKNENLKRLNHLYKVIDTCAMPGGPNRICLTGIREIAVTLGSKKKIQFVSITDKMRPTHAVCVDHACYGIAYQRNILYVTNGSDRTYIYDMSCDEAIVQFVLLGCIYSMLPLTVIVNCSGTNVIIGGLYKKILVCDLNGNLLRKIRVNESVARRGVCVDDKGNVFLTSNNNYILQFDEREDNPCLNKLHTADLHFSKTLMIDNVQSNLLLQRYNLIGGSDTIAVYNINYK